jgi:hypothetical protein
MWRPIYSIAMSFCITPAMRYEETESLENPEDTRRAARLRRNYILWWVFMPSVTFFLAFCGLCLIECTGLPFLTIFVGPIAIMVVGIVIGIIYWRAAASLPEPLQRSTRKIVLTSILWGPLLAGAVVPAGLMVLGMFSGLITALF